MDLLAQARNLHQNHIASFVFVVNLSGFGWRLGSSACCHYFVGLVFATASATFCRLDVGMTRKVTLLVWCFVKRLLAFRAWCLADSCMFQVVGELREGMP